MMHCPELATEVPPDLPALAGETIRRLQRRLAANPDRLPDKALALATAELADLAQHLTGPPREEYRSALPPAWLEARWNLVCAGHDGWLPLLWESASNYGYTPVGGTTSARVYRLVFLPLADYRLEGKPAAQTRWGRVCLFAAPILRRLLAHSTNSRFDEVDDWLLVTERAKSLARSFQPAADCLLDLPFVRLGRSHALWEQSLPAARRGLPQSPNIYIKEIGPLLLGEATNTALAHPWEQLSAALTIELLVRAEQLKVRLAACFEPAGSGSLIRVTESAGVSRQTAARLVQFQRLAVLLIWLLRRGALAGVDQATLDYTELSAQLAATDCLATTLLTDERDRAAGWWRATAEALEAAAAGKGFKSLPAPVDLRLWHWSPGLLRGGAMTIGLTDRLTPAGVDALASADLPQQPTVLFAGALDGLTAARLQGLVWRGLEAPHGLAVVHGDAGRTTCAAPFDGLQEAAQEALTGALERLLDRLGRPAPPPTPGGDLTLGAARAASALDPGLHRCWLGFEHLDWLRQSGPR